MPQTTSSDASLPAIAADLWELVKTYAKQETIGPIKGLGRWVALGLAGAVALSIGLVLLSLAVLRALQTETGSTFTGSWSWAPYLLTLVLVGVAIGLTLGATKKRSTSLRKASR